jgi:hypothetical protein
MGAPVGNYRVVVNNQVTPMMGEYTPAPAASPKLGLRFLPSTATCSAQDYEPPFPTVVGG